MAPKDSRERRTRRLAFRIARILQENPGTEDMLRAAQAALMDCTDANYGFMVLLNDEAEYIEFDMRFGSPPKSMADRGHRSGESLLQRVINDAAPAALLKSTLAAQPLIPSGSAPDGREPGLPEVALIGVPMLGRGGEAIGALAADRLFLPGKGLNEEVELLGELADTIAGAVELRRTIKAQTLSLSEELALLRVENLARIRAAPILGNSHPIRQVRHFIHQVAPSRASVLITGEAGTGKERVAEAIHAHSPRAERPFVRLNLAGMPEAFIERELFGLKRNAPAGAFSVRAGRLELARGGTLFLDEIGHLSIKMQGQLLRELDPAPFREPDGPGPIEDVRIISSSSRDLEELIRTFRFRTDLYYRLSLFPIFVPPLRDRQTDIPILADHFAVRALGRHGHRVGAISPYALELLMKYQWPGNVQELADCVDRAARASSGVIYGRHLPLSVQEAGIRGECPTNRLHASLQALKRTLLADALHAAGGKAAEAARALGISERQMQRRLVRCRLQAGNKIRRESGR